MQPLCFGRALLRRLIFFGALLLVGAPARAYSVFTHQANIDTTWAAYLRPALARRFPGGTPEEWREAKAYAYGGAIVQDMGYYPFGSKLFTDLTHYVRSGDFVRNLLLEARDRNELAFALGALAHYAADVKGHADGTNRVVPLLYPELQAKYGPVVTYEQDPVAHTRVEFGFDVVQLAAGRFRAEGYHDFIGFKVSKDVLERAFRKTYGLELGKVVLNVDLSIGSFRFAVRQLLPVVSRAAWRMNRKEILKSNPRARRREYLYRQNEREYRREFGGGREQPGLGARLMAGLVRVLPKVGPLRALKLKTPNAAQQAIFRASFREVVRAYSALLLEADNPAALHLPNTDFDTGHPTRFGEYPLADRTYGKWLRELAGNDFKDLTPAVRQNILAFFAGERRQPADEEEKESDTRRKTEAALAKLKLIND